MIWASIIVTLLAVYLLQDDGQLTQSLFKKLASLSLLVAGGVLLSMEYGTLRGVFILIGLASLVGTIFTLLRYKWAKS